MYDLSLAETLQHKFRGNKGNVKPEIAWRRLRDAWSPEFENILTAGVDAGWYDPDQPLQRYVLICSVAVNVIALIIVFSQTLV